MKPASQLPLAAQDSQLAAPADNVSIGHLLQSVLEKGGFNSESVGVVERLADLYVKMQDRTAEREFAAAFAALQADLRPVQATRSVPDKQGNVRYTYAPFPEIMAQVKPLCEKNGFSISFSTDFKDSRIVQTCTLQHRSGHKRDYTAYVRSGQGPYGATETQADGAAMTYAKRYALCNALNITVEHDTDARAESGEKVSIEQAGYLKERVKETGGDSAAFLKYAGAASYDDIAAEKYDMLIAAIERKGRAK